jgi:lysyl-tRNA synthetase class 2
VNTSSEPSKPAGFFVNLRARARILHQIRAFFAAREVLEVETPSLGRGGIADATLSPFATRLDPAPGGPQPLYLQTSPEVFMKRLLASGSGPIFQICKAYRNGEVGAIHNPEFTILEWYRPGWTHEQLMDEVEALFHVVVPHRPAAHCITYQRLFQEHLGLDPHRTNVRKLQETCQNLGVDAPASLPTDQIAPWLDLLLGEVVEPALIDGPPVFVTDYPAGRAALAAVRPGKPPVEERFELYDRGVELANGFRELTDPEEQARRFREINRERSLTGLAELPPDQRFLTCLPDMPPTSGVAVGLDRLVMRALNAASLDEVQAFPFSRL